MPNLIHVQKIRGAVKFHKDRDFTITVASALNFGIASSSEEFTILVQLFNQLKFVSVTILEFVYDDYWVS
jgi:hypothetical protein